MASPDERNDPGGGGSRARRYRLVIWLLAGVIWAAVLLVLASAVALRTVDLSRFTGTITAAVKSQTGRELTVGKGPYARVSLAPTVVLENVTLSNAPWGSRKEMLRVKRVELRLRLLALLRRQVLVERLMLVEPDLLLETNPKGEGNWVFAQAVPTESTGSSGGTSALASRLGIHELQMSDAVLGYRDGCAGWRVEAAVRLLTLVPSRSAKGNLDVDGMLTLERANVSVSGAIGGLEAVLGSGPFPIKLAFSTKDAMLTIEGAIRQVRDLAGVELNVGLEASDATALAASLGVPLSAPTPLRVECRLRDSGKAWVLDPVRATVGKSEVQGSLSCVSGCPRSTVAVVLRAPLLDLSQLSGKRTSPGASPATRPAKGGKLFSAEPLPLGMLKAIDATADLRADTLVLPSGTRVRSLAVRASLANGRLAADPLSMELGEGRIAGSLRLDAGRRQSFAANLTGSAVELKTLLGLADVQADVSGAPTDLSVSLAGSGGSLHDWMAGLGGKVRIVVGPGRIEGAALRLGGDVITQALDAVNPARRSETSTELRCAVINVPVDGGIVRFDRRVAAETSQINLAVEGTANLGTEMLDLGFRSKATQGLGVGLANFAGAARIRGPFTSPTLGLDAEGAAAAANTVQSLFKTRGRSLLEDRVKDLLTAGSPCKEALSEAAPARQWPLSLFQKR
ncbi:MAG TPA: AsmA family protein [Thermoanaerobaculaceae bacterium]|nr:AsmA family protein [Thermoanaerobaculaceae bacterium]